MLPLKYFQENYTQILAIFIVSLSMLNNGLFFAWPSYALLELTKSTLTYSEASYFTVLPPIATVLTSFLVGAVGQRVGRKKTLVFGALPYLAAWMLTAIGGSKWTFFAARLATGVADSCTICASPLYVGEISRPQVRGTWGNLLVLNFSVGILLSYVLGGYLALSTAAWVCAAITSMQFALMLCIPESPYFLIMKKREDAARRSLEWLRRTRDVDAEFAEISRAVERQMQDTGRYKDIFANHANRRALFVIILLRMVQQFGGMSAAIMYSHTIFERAGGDLSSTTSSIICAGIALVVTVIGAVFVDHFGRRKTLFCSTISSCLLLILMSIYFYIDTETSVDVTQFTWIPLAGMITYLVVYCLGLAIVPVLMSGEMFSSSIKEKSMSINNITNAVLIATTTKIFHALSEHGLHVPFTFYACSCLMLTFVCYYVVPETKGKTLDEIQLELTTKPRNPKI